ncbi:MAG TPA: hypothetical protein VF727_17720 [Allosphingosinicella sp.]|jgi:hypothetical protein
MAFTLNHYDADNQLFTLTLHETAAAGKNRVVHVIVPNAVKGRVPASQLQAQARAAAKKTLQDAAASL